MQRRTHSPTPGNKSTSMPMWKRLLRDTEETSNITSKSKSNIKGKGKGEGNNKSNSNINSKSKACKSAA